jgi:hypothetical protein
MAHSGDASFADRGSIPIRACRHASRLGWRYPSQTRAAL